MEIVTQQMLREELIALLLDTEEPTTAGDFTKKLNMRGVLVKRGAVQAALEHLCGIGKAMYVWARVQRNGHWVTGRHYCKPPEKGAEDPFDGIAV